MSASTWSEPLDALFGTWNRPDRPGCALGIYREGELVFARGYGRAHLEHGAPITPDTVFHVASISKQFTAFLIALLAREGRLAITDDVRRYIPEWPAGPALTLGHLVHHTSGLRDQWDLLRLAGFRHADLKTTGDVLRLALRQQGLNFQTGTRFQYINTGYTLLAIVVERITGRSFRRAAEELLFAPLGMGATLFQDDHREVLPGRAQAYSRDEEGRLMIDMPDYATVGPTGLLSTLRDFARWEQNLLAPTVGDVELIQTVVTPGSLDDGRPTNYAHGWVVATWRGLPTLEHAGGDAGYRAHFLRFPSERLAIAIFANCSEVRPGELAHHVAEVCLAGRLTAAGSDSNSGSGRAWAGRALGIDAPPAADLESMAGTYREVSGGIHCVVEHRGGRLFLIAPGELEYELAPWGGGHFRFLGSDVDCVFERAETTGGWRIVVFHGGAETAVCDQVEAQPTGLDEPPTGYVGSYWSDETESVYRVANGDGGLVLERPRATPAPLRRQGRDQFSDGDGRLHLQFLRDEESRITGFLVSAERVWNVRFKRTALDQS